MVPEDAWQRDARAPTDKSVSRMRRRSRRSEDPDSVRCDAERAGASWIGPLVVRRGAADDDGEWAAAPPVVGGRPLPLFCSEPSIDKRGSWRDVDDVRRCLRRRRAALVGTRGGEEDSNRNKDRAGLLPGEVPDGTEVLLVENTARPSGVRNRFPSVVRTVDGEARSDPSAVWGTLTAEMALAGCLSPVQTLRELVTDGPDSLQHRLGLERQSSRGSHRLKKQRCVWEKQSFRAGHRHWRPIRVAREAREWGQGSRRCLQWHGGEDDVASKRAPTAPDCCFLPTGARRPVSGSWLPSRDGWPCTSRCWSGAVVCA